MKKMKVFWVLGISLIQLVNAGPTDLDQTFGIDGIASTQVGLTGNGPGKIALRPGGGIAQTGVARDNSSSGSYGYDVAVVCYAADGQLDTSFSTDGMLMTDINSNHPVYTDDRGSAVLVQPDGKILVGGTTRQYTKSGSASFEWYMWDLLLVRYLPNGDLDANFADGGIMVHDMSGTGSSPEGIFDLDLQSDGKIVFAGYKMVGYNNRFLMGRFNTDGTLDSSFGSGGTGLVEQHFSGNTLEDAYDIIVLDDDSMIVVGRGVNASGNSTISVLKLTDSGSLDTTFASGGKFLTIIGGTCQGNVATIDESGRIYVAGKTSDRVGNDESIFVLRLLANGVVDDSFGAGGHVILDLGDSKYQTPSTVFTREDGSITVVASGSTPYVMGLARWDQNGMLDPAFGENGSAAYNVAGANYLSIRNAVPLPDDKILVGANLEYSGSGTTESNFAVFRLGYLPPWNDAAVDLMAGWSQLDWFGTYYTAEDDWIYHTELGYLKVLPASTASSMICYSPRFGSGWMWTCDLAFPWTYEYERGGWTYPDD